MKSRKIIKKSLVTLSVLLLTACGGGSSNDSSCSMTNVKDSDKDGFYDEKDIAPSDAFRNGNFYSLEKLIDSSEVKKVLNIAKEHGVIIRTELEQSPPNLTGYYKAEVGGEVVANQRNFEIGNEFLAIERRICAKKGYIEMASIEAIDGFFNKGIKIRGHGKYFTQYYLTSFYSSGCTLYNANIKSGEVESGSGNIINIKTINVPLESKGTCSGRISGWAVYKSANLRKITNLDELEYMCVDGDKAYVPTETWINKDKETCTCTKDIEIECS